MGIDEKTQSCIFEACADIFSTRSPNEFAEKASEILASYLGFDGLSILQINGRADDSNPFSTFYSLQGTPTNIVFEKQAFSNEISEASFLLLNKQHISDLNNNVISERYNFYSAQFGKTNQTGLVVIGFAKIRKPELEKLKLESWASLSTILGNHYQVLKELSTCSIEVFTNLEKDTLTKVHNYESFKRKLSSAIDVSSKSHKTEYLLACVVISLDEFSMINKKYGFDLGNEVLFEIARKLENTVREEDIVGRIGGDMFGLILKNVGSYENCQKVTNRIANIFRKGLLPVGEDLTASLGVSLFPNDSKDFEELIIKAESSATMAKKIPGTFTLFAEEKNIPTTPE